MYICYIYVYFDEEIDCAPGCIFLKSSQKFYVFIYEAQRSTFILYLGTSCPNTLDFPIDKLSETLYILIHHKKLPCTYINI